MRFELTEDQELFRKTVREFAAKEVAPHAARVDREAAFPENAVKGLADLGLMGIAIPGEYGGAGTDMVCYAIAMEEIARACASTSVVMSVNNSLVAEPLYRFGSEAQRRTWLVAIASGKRLGCFALSEPAAGSDAAGLQTTAREDGRTFVLNGTKSFVTNALEADIALVFATVDRRLRARGVCAFLVEKGTRGFSVTRVEEKLGIKGSSCCQVVLEECRIPTENLLGEVGQGFKIAMVTLDVGRIGIAAQAVGIAQAALDIAAAYAKQRVAFGTPIASFQAIQGMIADITTQTEAARLLTYRAALLKDRGVRHTKESAMAKLYASETASRAATRALQIHGGYGYLRDFAAQRLFRDARITEIYEGTSEIQRLVIAEHLLN